MFQGSYGYNGWLYSDGDGMVDGETGETNKTLHALFFTKEAGVEKPTQTPVFFDANCVDAWPLENDLPNPDLYHGGSLL